MATKKCRNYAATEATLINVRASRKTDSALAARVRILEGFIDDLAVVVLRHGIAIRQTLKGGRA